MFSLCILFLALFCYSFQDLFISFDAFFRFEDIHIFLACDGCLFGAWEYRFWLWAFEWKGGVLGGGMQLLFHKNNAIKTVILSNDEHHPF